MKVPQTISCKLAYENGQNEFLVYSNLVFSIEIRMSAREVFIRYTARICRDLLSVNVNTSFLFGF